MKDKYYNDIKYFLLNNKITKTVKDYSKNISGLNTYYKVGKLLFKAGNCYGEKVIGKYAEKLIYEVEKNMIEVHYLK